MWLTSVNGERLVPLVEIVELSLDLPHGAFNRHIHAVEIIT